MTAFKREGVFSFLFHREPKHRIARFQGLSYSTTIIDKRYLWEGLGPSANTLVRHAFGSENRFRCVGIIAKGVNQERFIQRLTS